MGCCNDGASVHPGFTQRRLDLQSPLKETDAARSYCCLKMHNSLLGLFNYASNVGKHLLYASMGERKLLYNLLLRS